jgi:hypothetical protein
MWFIMNIRFTISLALFFTGCGEKLRLGSSAPEEGERTVNNLYTSCDNHGDCSKGMFCGIECWTGTCGADGSIPEATMGQFCQPCVECEIETDAVDGNCEVCIGSN